MSEGPPRHFDTANTDVRESPDEHDLLTAAARQRIGSTLREKWHLDALLGVGGMAAVFAATHRNKSRAAVKVLHRELGANREVRARFLREGYVANAVEHEGVVKVLDDDVAEDGSLFLVTELLDGETLEDRRLRLGGSLPADDVLQAAEQVLAVLEVAHAKGVVHRDLKPENLFLTRDGRIKVLDFGIARLRELWSASTATRSGAAMGTPVFMPPEQARGLWAEVDGRSDIWAVGATMFNLLSGSLVHEGRTMNETLLSAMTKPAPKLCGVAPRVDPVLADVVDRALEFGKALRWPDAASMREAVVRVRRELAQASEAVRLSVPASVVNRTLAGSARVVAVSAVATTNGPVTDGMTGEDRPPRRTGSSNAILLVAGALLIAAFGVVAGLRFARYEDRSSATTADDPWALPPSSAHAAVLPSAPPPELAPLIEPSAAPKDTTWKMGSRPDAAPRAPALHCATPYVLDPKTGKKIWRAECF